MMNARPVRDVMTKDVVSVRTYASFRSVAAAMLGHEVGALPVIDSAGHPLGMVSRTDLLAKRARDGHGLRGAVCQALTVRGRRTVAAARGNTAASLASRRVVTVAPEDSVFRAAYLMRRHDVSHLPVVDRHGVLIGIVARGDLLDEFMREDKLIADDVRTNVLAHRLPDLDAVQVRVERGVVTLSGRVSVASDALYAVERTRKTAGVVDIVDHLKWAADDRKPVYGRRS